MVVSDNAQQKLASESSAANPSDYAAGSANTPVGQMSIESAQQQGSGGCKCCVIS